MMNATRWSRMLRVWRAYPRWLWNEWPVHAAAIVVFGIPFVICCTRHMYKNGIYGQHFRPYFRNNYDVVRPDDPTALAWRVPEDYPAPWDTNRANRYPTSYWKDYGFGLKSWKH